MKYFFLILFIPHVLLAQEFNHFQYNGGLNFASEGTPLFDRIAREFTDYKVRADEAAARLVQSGDLSVIGGLSGLGFTVAKGFGTFSINANRQLAPDLFDDKRWIIVDELTIIIDAQKLLGDLQSEGTIDISETNLGAFAGVAFKRVYRFTHFANSYSEGLTKNYDRLIFPFRWFRSDRLNQLSPYEFLEAHDSLSFKAGGLVSAPIGAGLAIGAGVLASFERQAEMSIQSLGPDDGGEVDDRVRVNFTKTKVKTLEAQARLQADFLGLLKLTLLSYDFSYSLSSSEAWFLKLKEQDLLRLHDGADPLLESALDDVIRLRTPRLESLLPYVVSQESRKEEVMKSRYAALLLGGRKEKRTEHVQTVKDGVVRSFFRHNFVKQREVQNAVSRLVSELFQNLLQMPTIVNNDALETKRVQMEYEANEDLLGDRDDLELSAIERKLSVSIKHEANVGSKSQKYRDYFAAYLSYYSGADPAIVSAIENGQFVAPYYFQNHYQISEIGIKRLGLLSSTEVHDVIDMVCETKPKDNFYRFRSLFNFCKSKLQKDYRNYVLELFYDDIKVGGYKECKKAKGGLFTSKAKKRMYLEACLRQISKRDPELRHDLVPLWRLKDFLDEFVSQSKSKTDVYQLFGLANVHGHGEVRVSQTGSFPVRSLFKEGLWQGTGVIDAARELQIGRAPASVLGAD